MKVATVLGARPQFIKAAPVGAALRRAGHRDVLIHTGQHYDHAMSQIFFDQLGLAAPDVNLGVGSGSHAQQTSEMLSGVDEVLQAEKPDAVIVYGDTNSTLAGALAACKRGIPLAHVEAGLRSYNRTMPEEHNRVLTDHCADLLFCPTPAAARNLCMEGLTRGVHVVGDTMYDAVRQFGSVACRTSTILRDLGLASKAYVLASVHRAYNTDDLGALESILRAFLSLDAQVVFPMHPRTRKQLERLPHLLEAVSSSASLRLLQPVGYFDMLTLEQHAKLIMTDSGGVQKEAYFFGVPCVTLRPETEWVETVDAGWNVVAGTSCEDILRVVHETQWPDAPPPQVFGDAHAALRIVTVLEGGSRS